MSYCYYLGNKLVIPQPRDRFNLQFFLPYFLASWLAISHGCRISYIICRCYWFIYLNIIFQYIQDQRNLDNLKLFGKRPIWYIYFHNSIITLHCDTDFRLFLSQTYNEYTKQKISLILDIFLRFLFICNCDVN